MKKRSHLLIQIKVNKLIKFGNENKSSNRLILKTGTLIRHEFGRNTVERTKEKTLPKMKDGMADLIDVKQVKTVRQRKGKERKPLWRLYLCCRLQGFLCQGKFLLHPRQISSSR